MSDYKKLKKMFKGYGQDDYEAKSAEKQGYPAHAQELRSGSMVPFSNETQKKEKDRLQKKTEEDMKKAHKEGMDSYKKSHK